MSALGLDKRIIEYSPPIFIALHRRLMFVATPGTLLTSLQGLPKLALSYIFKGLDTVNPVESKDERIRMLKRVEFYSVVEAGALGLLSGLILLLFTLWIEPLRGTILENEFWDNVAILGIIIAVGVVITMIELTVMYFLSLRNARIIASLNEQSTSSEDIDEQVMVALVNAGLQTPNNTGEFFGINPRKHMSKFSIAIAAFFLEDKSIWFKSDYQDDVEAICNTRPGSNRFSRCTRTCIITCLRILEHVGYAINHSGTAHAK